MITSIKLKNIKSIKECELNFEKGKYQYLNEMIFKNKVVSPMGIYGSNGSGKSSFLYSLMKVGLFMYGELNNITSFEPNQLTLNMMFDKKRYKSNKLSQAEIQEVRDECKSSIEISFLLNKDKYCYFLETSFSGFISREYLICNNITFFNRDKNILVIDNKEEKIDGPLYSALRKIVNETANVDKLCKAYSFLSSISYVNAPYYFISKINVGKSFVDVLSEQSDNVKNILKKYNEFPLYTISTKTTFLGKKFASVNMMLEDNKSMELVWEQISNGMKNQSMMLSLVSAMPKGSVLVVDEIEDGLHPSTIKNFLEVVREKEIQLIFSSHNTFILSLLRPDQIAFAHWKNGYSTINRLSDIYPNIREVNNIEKMYLSNMFDEDIKGENG